MLALVIVLLVLLLFWVLYDVNYTIYLYTVILYSLIRKKSHPAKILDESSFNGFCFTTDAVTPSHMTNAKYLMKCDFARFKHLMTNDVQQTVGRLGGHTLVTACNIRYRRSLKLLDSFTIYTKILYWDENSFFIEHMFERRRDGFICAVATVKMTVIGCTIQNIVDSLEPGLTSPDPTPEVLNWIKNLKISSERLRNIEKKN